MDSYEGMRWVKCDLHMHSPAGASGWRRDKIESGHEKEAAERFARACYESGLDVIGITDHNFKSKDFLPHLQRALADLSAEYDRSITMFPGFEFEADVGKGMHVICLFEPDSSLEEVDHILTECGVDFNRFTDGTPARSTKRLPDIVDIVQKQDSSGQRRGVVIVPHVFDDSLFDNARISEWLQREEYLNPKLLAVEVPKPVDKMNATWQKLFKAGSDCEREWKRSRPIATVMSSDNKTLVERDADGKALPNSIGYRYSWIKMSRPSIESLRQAFLDSGSRIRLPADSGDDQSPSAIDRHAEIRSLSVSGVDFLADQTIHFSPNMNCIIGGRGSGKSTILEYLRILVGKDKNEDLDTVTQDRIARIRQTLCGAEAQLKASWRSAVGAEDTFVWSGGDHFVEGRELDDVVAYFDELSARFYSQQELSRLTEAKVDGGDARQAQRLLELIDGFSDDLADLIASERRLKQEAGHAFAAARRIKELDGERKVARQGLAELDRQLAARKEIQEDAKRYRLLKAEVRYLDEVLGPAGQQPSDIADAAETIAASHRSFSLDGAPHEKWFKDYDLKIRELKEQLGAEVKAAVDRFHSDAALLKSEDPAWQVINEELEGADESFKVACEEKELTPDDVGRLSEIAEARERKQQELEEIEARLVTQKEDASDPESLMEQLHGVWRKQHAERRNAAEAANSLAVLEGREKPFINVTAEFQQDRISFRRLWDEFGSLDRRTRLGRNWDELGDAVHRAFADSEMAGSPWDLLKRYLDGVDDPGGEIIGIHLEELQEHINTGAEKWERLRMSRVQDSVDMELFRHDGSRAGSIGDGSLSDGQRNTAALALLLAQEGGPLIIDQPEDELDSNFVFRELVPMLRMVKSKRQLIMATHNANLPVNGDAELVYALEARDGHGHSLAQGGLDCPSVTEAVLDIMEGTEEAFLRRREKYNF